MEFTSIIFVTNVLTSADINSNFYRAQLVKQYEQKTRQAVENARLLWQEQQQQEISKTCDDAVKRQRELWMNERRENLSALEKLKHELGTVKKEYAITLDKLKREVSEEKKKTQYNFKRRDSRDYATQVWYYVTTESQSRERFWDRFIYSAAREGSKWRPSLLITNQNFVSTYKLILPICRNSIKS